MTKKNYKTAVAGARAQMPADQYNGFELKKIIYKIFYKIKSVQLINL